MVCVIASYLVTYQAGPISTFYMEWLSALGFVLAAGIFFQVRKFRLLEISWTFLIGAAFIAFPFLFSWGDFLAGRVVYPGNLVQYMILGVAALAILLVGFLAGAEPALTPQSPAKNLLSLFWLCLAVAGLLNGVTGFLQYFFVPYPTWIAPPLTDAGRIYGNLRQPNHYALLLNLAVVALSYFLGATVQRSRRALLVLLIVLAGAAAALSGSRTGVTLAWCGAVVALFAHRLPGSTRLGLVAGAVAQSSAWYVYVSLDKFGLLPFFGITRLMPGESDATGSRWGVWEAMLGIIDSFKIFGVGYGNLNYAYFMSESVNDRLALNLQNAHNIFLHFGVEHGLLFLIPWAALLALMAWLARSIFSTLDGGLAALGVIYFLIHSMLEYPLWYSYFLFPAVFLTGLVLAKSDSLVLRGRTGCAVDLSIAVKYILVFGVSMLAFLPYDYMKIQSIFSGGKETFASRIERGYQSLIFTSYMDYGVVTSTPVERQNATMHLQLASRVSKIVMTPGIAMSLAISNAFLGKQKEAGFFLERIRQASCGDYGALVDSLTPEQRAALKPQLDKPSAECP